MSDNVVNYWSGFRSQSGEQMDAVADPVTNTLDIFVPSEDVGEMTLVHAFVSREEFMHGEWDIGLLVQLAQLRLAAIQSLLRAIEEPGRRDEHIARFKRVNETAVDIQNQLRPFQEAVDKLQILSVTRGDDEFQNSIVEAFRQAHEDSEYDIEDELNKRIKDQYEIATGESHANPEDESLYVNPLYYYALDEVASRYGEEGSESGGVSTGRSIAESVARATLDVVHPIAPLTSSDQAGFKPLGMDNLTVEQTTLADLESKFEISDEAYEQYLLAHESEITDSVVRQKLGLGEDPDPSEIERTLVDNLFVNCLQALELIEQKHDVTELDADELRRLLVEELHDVDIGDPKIETVLDNVNPLLSLPRDAAESKPDQDFVDVESDPLPKVLIEAFEQHGAFGAVRFRRSVGDLRRQLNWNVIEEPVPNHPTVPDGIDTYQGMWEHYYFGKALADDLIAQQRPYIVSRISEHFGGDKEVALEELESIFSGPRTSKFNQIPGGTGAEDGRTGFAMSGSSVLDDAVETVIDSSRDKKHEQEPEDDEESEDDDSEGFDEWTLLDLITAARRAGIDLSPPDDVSHPPTELSVECPFCEFSYDLCGDDRCVTEDRRRRYESTRPELIWSLLIATR
jgi:hypothetical protein